MYLLLKALYGLKQALLLQYDKFTKFAKKHGFDPFLSDAYIFRNATTGVIIVIYIDDVLLIAKLLSSIFDTAELISTTFLIRLLGELHFYLRIRVIRDRQKRQLIVVQDAYIDKIVTKFNLYNAPTSLPLRKDLTAQLYTLTGDYTATNKLKTKYQTLVGSAVQLVYISRPDCSYEVRLLY